MMAINLVVIILGALAVTGGLWSTVFLGELLRLDTRVWYDEGPIAFIPEMEVEEAVAEAQHVAG